MYTFENNLRKVVPYYQTYKTHVKSRWEGRTIPDVFVNELGHVHDALQKDILNQRITIEENHGKRAPSSVISGTILNNRRLVKHDVIHNTKHMHEPSVIIDNSVPSNCQQSQLNVVHHDNDYLVVNKPSGIPTHPTGNYRYNSVSEILKHDFNLRQIWTCHRLDKVTSGILIFALNAQKGKEMQYIIEHKGARTTKSYVARVLGRFPAGDVAVRAPVFLVNPNGGYFMPTNLQCATDSTTKFQLLRYCQELDQSVVKCTPISGKMHQIRIHLRNLGFPIVNDFVYNNRGELSEINRLKNEIEMKVYERIDSAGTGADSAGTGATATVDLSPHIHSLNPLLTKIKHLAAQRIINYRTDKLCHECGAQLFPEERDQNHSFIWLHAYKYEYNGDGEGFNFETPLPSWCNFDV